MKTFTAISFGLIANVLLAHSQELPRLISIDPPNGAAFVGKSHGVRFTVEDDKPIGFASSLVQVKLKGESEFSGILAFAPQNDERTVSQIVITAQDLPLNEELFFELLFVDEDGNKIEATHYFDTFDLTNPIIEAEQFAGFGDPDPTVQTLESTDVARDWIFDEEMITGIDPEDTLDYTHNFPEANYHVYLKEKLDEMEVSMIALQKMNGEEATELGVFKGVATDGTFRNFQLMHRNGTRPVVTPLNGPTGLRLVSETDDADGGHLFLNYLVFVPTDEPVQAIFLQSSTDVQGPYTDDPEAIIDEQARTIETTRAGAQSFYLIDGIDNTGSPIIPTAIELNDNTVRIRFDP